MSCAVILRVVVVSVVIAAGVVVQGQESSPPAAPARQALDDAWWTGPMLAPSAATLPRGHFLIEPYIFDVITQGQFDSHGDRRSAAHTNSLGSLTYINYGLMNRFTVGVIPTAGYNAVSAGSSSSGVQWGDVSVQGQLRLRQFHEGSWIPTMSVSLQETLPSGRYDRLGTRPSNGLGSGAFTTTLGFYSQTYFWLPNARILRMRLNMTESFSNSPRVEDVSVYGTAEGFRGHAHPGSVSFIDGAWEYSLTRSWVLALDAVYRYQQTTRVSGTNILDTAAPDAPVQFTLGSSATFALAPAVEYSWKRNLGVLLGVRTIPAGRNTTYSITPVVAVNYVH